MNLPIIGCSGGDGYASKVLSLASWGVAYDARYPGGNYKDTGLATACSVDGDAVAYWRDWSGNGRNATQATAANQCAWQLGLSGSINGVSTVGADDLYTIGGSNAGYATAVHGFAVLNWTGTPDATRHALFGGGAGRALFLRVGRSTENSGELQLGEFTAGALVTTGGAFATGISLVEFQYKTGANAVKLRVNQGSTLQGTAAGALDNPITRLLCDTFSQSWLGDLYSLYISQGADVLSAGNVTAIRTQLGVEFGQAWS